jgi:hypothetical protein
MDDFIVCDMLFSKYKKPIGFQSCKAINVYDNKYRINVYTTRRDVLHDLDRTRINHSVFARLDKKNNLQIIRSEGEELEPKISA